MVSECNLPFVCLVLCANFARWPGVIYTSSIHCCPSLHSRWLVGVTTYRAFYQTPSLSLHIDHRSSLFWYIKMSSTKCTWTRDAWAFSSKNSFLCLQTRPLCLSISADRHLRFVMLRLVPLLIVHLPAINQQTGYHGHLNSNRAFAYLQNRERLRLFAWKFPKSVI